jgi:hypothetical protein
MALKEEIDEILERGNAMEKLMNAFDERQRHIGDLMPKDESIALLLVLADNQNAALLRLAEEIAGD